MIATSSGGLSGSEPHTPGGERVIYVIARDVLSLDRERLDLGWLAAAWKGRWLVVASMLIFGLVATIWALVAAEWYQAEVVLTPTPQHKNSPLASLGGAEGAGLLAGLAGLRLGATGTAESIGVLKSHEFARQFIEDNGLVHVLLSDKWDARAGRWKESLFTRQPDIRDAVRYFQKKILSVEEDKRTELVTVGVEWKDAATAATWANTIVDRLNEQMRSRALTEGEANVAYLQKELSATTVVPVQQAISRLLESELQKVMMARGEKQFSFRIVDPAAVPKWRSWPKRAVWIAIGILGGGLFGLFAVFVRQSLRTYAARP